MTVTVAETSEDAQGIDIPWRMSPPRLGAPLRRLRNASVVVLLGHSDLLVRQIPLANGLHESPELTNGAVLEPRPAELQCLDRCPRAPDRCEQVALAAANNDIATDLVATLASNQRPDDENDHDYQHFHASRSPVHEGGLSDLGSDRGERPCPVRASSGSWHRPAPLAPVDQDLERHRAIGGRRPPKRWTELCVARIARVHPSH
jgi:hypothetical protein